MNKRRSARRGFATTVAQTVEQLEARTLLTGTLPQVQLTDVGYLGGKIRDVAVAGTYAYLAATNEVRVVDISNPAAPTLVGVCQMPEAIASGVAVDGNYAYVTTWLGGLKVVDVSDRTKPVIVATFDVAGGQDIQVAGGYAYVAADDGMEVVDVSDPLHPTLTATYAGAENLIGLTVSGSYAYIVNPVELDIVNITDPSNPTLVGTDTLSGFPMDIAVSGDLAVVGVWSDFSFRDRGVCVLDVSNPTLPVSKGNIVVDTSEDFRFAVSGNSLYVSIPNTLERFDLTNTAQPTLTGSCTTSGYGYGVAIAGGYAYVSAGTGMDVVTLGSLANVSHCGVNPGYVDGISLNGTQLTVHEAFFGTRTIDISDPDSPVVTGSAAGVNLAQTTEVIRGNYRYTMTSMYLNIYDLTLPANSSPVGWCALATSPFLAAVGGLAVDGPYAYAVTTAGINVIDISDPTNPQLAANTYGSLATFDYGIAISGSYAYVAAGPAGLEVLKLDFGPRSLAVSSERVDEGRLAGTAVGSLSAMDPDAGDTFTYSLVDGTGSDDNASFVIVGDQLQTAAIFDYEAKSSYTIRVRVTESGGLTFEKAFAITVTDVNETPTDIALSNVSVAENQPAGTMVGLLSATDLVAGDTFTYQLVNSGRYPDNASFTIVGKKLKTNAVFDYETKSSYSIRIRVTEQSGLSFAKTFTIVLAPPAQTATVGQGQLFTLGNFAQFNATAPFSVSVNWGDGSANKTFSVAAAGAIPPKAHIYTTVGSDTATVIVKDSTSNVVSVATFGVTVTHGAPATLAFITQPTATIAGNAISPAVTVAIEDAYGNVVSESSGLVTLAIRRGPAGSVLGGVVAVHAQNGVATFSNVLLNTAGDYKLSAGRGVLSPATSTKFTVSAAAAAKLAIITQPSAMTKGSGINAAIVVHVEDQFGNLVTADDSDVLLSIKSGPAGAILGGTDMVAASGGVATFSDVLLDMAGPYRLKAMASGLATARTVFFTVR